MIQTISEYTPGLALPNYEKTNYDPTLEMQLLVKRQQEYDTTLQRINNLKSTSMNVLMLNKYGQEKLDNYNKELHNMLSQDLGDLTDTTVQAKVSGYFNQVANDTDLKMRSRYSQHYKTEKDNILRMKNDPNPEKSGYNAEHEFVFDNWEGGMNDFYNAKDVNNWDQKKISYTPFKDVNQKMVNFTKLLHEEEKSVQGQTLMTIKDPESGKEIQVPTGYTSTNTTKGVSAERFRKLMEENFTLDELAQFKVKAQYRVIQSNTPEGKARMYEAYDYWIKTEQANTELSLKQIQGQISQFDPEKLDKTLPDYENRKVVYEETVKNLRQQEAFLSQAKERQTLEVVDKDKWNNFSMNEMLPYVTQMTTEKYINGMSEALGYKSEYQKIGTDEPYWLGKKMDLAERRMQLDEMLGVAALELKARELAMKEQKESKQGKIDANFDDPTDASPTPEDMVRTMDDFKGMVSSYGKKVDPLITEKDADGKYKFDLKLMKDKNWVSENKDNYQVKLFENFQAMSSPEDANNIAAFEAFIVKAENGDFANKPSVQAIYDQYVLDKDISEFLDEKAMKITGATNGMGDKTFERVLLEEMPNIFQYKQRVGKTPEAIKEVIGEIQASVKLSNPDMQIAIPEGAIDQVAIPHSGGGINSAGYFVLKNNKETLEGVRKAKTRLKLKGSNEYHEGKDIQPGVQYEFAVAPQHYYDSMTNWMFQDKGIIKRNIAGYKVEFKKAGSQNIVHVHVNGEQTEVDISNRDIAAVVKEFEAGLREKARIEKQSKKVNFN